MNYVLRRNKQVTFKKLMKPQLPFLFNETLPYTSYTSLKRII